MHPGCTATIYTDSQYAVDVHDFESIWRQRAFLTAAGVSIKYSSFVSDLMSACKRPTRLAVVKIKAHCSPDTHEARGNAMADAVAKTACRLSHQNLQARCS